MKLDTVDQILSFAIEQEKKAVEFYAHLAEKQKNENLKHAFLEFSRQESWHMHTFMRMKEHSIHSFSDIIHPPIKIADSAEILDKQKIQDFEDAIFIAIDEEDAAIRFYSDLLEFCNDDSVKEMLEKIVSEEKHHKQQLEAEYKSLFSDPSTRLHKEEIKKTYY